jgi:hypothetical protein
MGWVTGKWDVSCNINPGAAVRDKLRHCFQQVSRNVRSETMIIHTGWYNDPQNGWAFLNGGESVGMKDVQVTLPGKLSAYAFPEVDETKILDSVKAVLKLPKAAPRGVILPLLAVTFLTPLNEFLKQAGYNPRFVTTLVGTTNSGKSTLAALFLSFFGKFNVGNLPMSFQDTGNSILYQAALLKDLLTCVDDFKPSTGGDNDRMLNIFQMLLRALGERTGRSRLNCKSELMANRPPEGNVLVTAEQIPNVGESGVTRNIILELHPGDVDFHVTDQLQKDAANRVLAQCMRAYIWWLKNKNIDPDPQVFVSRLEKDFLDNRTVLSDLLGKTAYPRVTEAFAHLLIGLNFFLNFAVDVHALSSEEALRLNNEMVDICKQMLRVYTDYTGAVKPTAMFIGKIGELMHSNAVYIHNSELTDGPIAQEHIGFYDRRRYYLHGEMAYRAVLKLCREQEIQFPLGMRALIKQLADAKLIVTDGEDTCPRHSFYGTRAHYLTFEKDVIDAA